MGESLNYVISMRTWCNDDVRSFILFALGEQPENDEQQ